MRAWILPRPQPVRQSPLRLVECPQPVPGPDEVLIRARVCGICRTDLHVIEGDLPVRRPQITPGHQIVGEVVEHRPPADVTSGTAPLIPAGTRVGVAWLHRTCGVCRFCCSQRENLCKQAEFTGWTQPGGFAEYLTAPARFVYPLPASFADLQAAPLLCAGIIGYRCLRLCGLAEWRGARLGIYGFGAAGHVVLQVARARGAEVYVCTRDRSRHQALAEELGAVWVGDATAPPPQRLDAAILFAPAGELVPVALAALDRGGSLVLGGIHMTPIPSFDYDLLYGERLVRSVANNTRADGLAFLQEAASIPVQTHVQAYPFDAVHEALMALKEDAIKGAGVLVVS